jgi:hypothetical protein
MSGADQTYSIDMDPYQELSAPDSTGYYTAVDPLESMNTHDPRHVSMQYSVVSEVDAEPLRGHSSPRATPVSPYERTYTYQGYQGQQYWKLIFSLKKP